MNTIKLTDHQLATLQNALTCYSQHLKGSLYAKELQGIYGGVTALMGDIEIQLEEAATYANKELDYE